MKKNGWFQHEKLEISPRQIWILATHGFIWSFGLFLGNSFYFFCRKANFLMLHVLLKLVRSSRKIDSCVFSNTFAPFFGGDLTMNAKPIDCKSRSRQLWIPIAFSRLLEIGKPNYSQIWKHMYLYRSIAWFSFFSCKKSNQVFVKIDDSQSLKDQRIVLLVSHWGFSYFKMG